MNHHSIRQRVLTSLLSLCLLLPLAAVPIGAEVREVHDARDARAVGSALTEAVLPQDGILTPILLDGEEVLVGECYRQDGVTYVPLRRFCALFAPSGSMTWNGRTNTAHFTTEQLELSVRVGKLYISANERMLFTVGAIRNHAGHLYVPIRPLARAFAAELEWDGERFAVCLTRGERSAIEPADYDEDAVYWLSRIISSESSVEPFLGQIAVGNVVLNRVRSREFPNTIWGVIFDRKHGTQFSPVAFGTIYEAPEPSCIIAAKICLEGYTLTDTALYFFDPDLSTSDWISRNCTFEFRIGSHEFYH